MDTGKKFTKRKAAMVAAKNIKYTGVEDEVLDDSDADSDYELPKLKQPHKFKSSYQRHQLKALKLTTTSLEDEESGDSDSQSESDSDVKTKQRKHSGIYESKTQKEGTNALKYTAQPVVPKVMTTSLAVTPATTHSKSTNVTAANQGPLLQCKVCQHQTTSESLMKAHENMHIVKSHYSCAFCSYSTSSKFQLTTHSKTDHSPSFRESYIKSLTPPADELGMYNCKQCEFSDRDIDTFFRHNFHHFERSSIVCPHCSYSAHVKWIIDNHMKVSHRKLSANKDPEMQRTKNTENVIRRLTSLTNTDNLQAVKSSVAEVTSCSSPSAGETDICITKNTEDVAKSTEGIAKSTEGIAKSTKGESLAKSSIILTLYSKELETIKKALKVEGISHSNPPKIMSLCISKLDLSKLL